MSRKNDELASIIDKVITSAQGMNKTHEIVDIITFCEDPRYLNFLGLDPQIHLWPMQRIVLKMFYRGTPGNEHVFLTDEEIEILRKVGQEEELDYDPELGGFEQVIEKYKRGTIFSHLLLIMGRRSSKTMMVSIIAAYEAYKLCECPEGNPQKFYKIAPDKPIHIINVAVNETQALDPLFAEIETRVIRSTYFQDKINTGSSIQGKIYILTDADKAENLRRREKGVDRLLPGSIILMSGHSNSASLRGHATKCVLFDEFAHFIGTGGRSSGDEVYNALLPSMKQFGKEGKIVMLSDPRGKEGMFWKLFEFSQKRETKADGTVNHTHDDVLALQLPTWIMNPTDDLKKEKLYREEYAKDPAAFMTSWGAKFVGAEGSRFFDPAKIENCIDIRAQEAARGEPNYAYYLHLDPATTSHNYALCLCHSVLYGNGRNEYRRRIVVDTVKYWRPDGSPVDITEVENTIRDLCRRFNVVQVSFDSFASQQTIQNLRACGINAVETPYRSTYITEIYGELRELVNQGNLILYPHELLIGEMKNLMYKILNRGIKRFFDPKGDYRSDDCVDALAGAAFQALNAQIVRSLPKSALVWTGWR